MNAMREVRIEKVVVNIGVGEAGDKLLRAQKVLESLTGQKAVQTLSKGTNRDFGIRQGMPIGAKVTLRGERADKFLREAFYARNNILFRYNFDPQGNFSFGVADYTDFKGVKYDPDIGLFGMDVSVALRRPGYRVGRRRVRRRRIPHRHRTTPNEAVDYVTKHFEVEVKG
ncbi:MAG: 50S ribosomal protein L5 [Thermoplasmata archaeon]